MEVKVKLFLKWIKKGLNKQGAKPNPVIGKYAPLHLVLWCLKHLSIELYF